MCQCTKTVEISALNDSHCVYEVSNCMRNVFIVCVHPSMAFLWDVDTEAQFYTFLVGQDEVATASHTATGCKA